VGTEWARRYVAGIVEDMVEERTREEVMSIFEGFHKMQKVEELLKKYLQELPEK
jgi:metal-dependent hydrolase (beta-lactamase superfamily II)